MALMLEVLELILGIVVVAYVLNDVFQSVVVPRPTPARYRVTRWVVRPGWRIWRTIGLRASVKAKISAALIQASNACQDEDWRCCRALSTHIPTLS